jgi:ferredoxin-NADP reductase
LGASRSGPTWSSKAHTESDRRAPDTPKVLLVAGIGIAPRGRARALRPGDLTLLYRVHDPGDVVFRGELDTLARARGARVHYLVGGRRPEGSDPLDVAALERLVPDVRDHDVYLCGPVPMMLRVEAALRRLGLPARQIHTERFAY